MNEKRLRPAMWRTVETPHGNASWAVIDDMLYVRSVLGNKATPIGNSHPETLARLLMVELAQEAKGD
jgi:hypothetical protein